MKPEDIKKTDLNTKYGQFEYLAMPMRFCNENETFQTVVEKSFTNVYMNVRQSIWMIS